MATICWTAHSYVCSFVNSCAHSFTHSFVRSFVRSFDHLFVVSFGSIFHTFSLVFAGLFVLSFLRSAGQVCSGSIISGHYSRLWTRRFMVRVPSGCHYSMRLDRLHRAYQSLHPFAVVHWVPVLSNIKTATGCESNRQLQLWTVFTGTVVYNYQFNSIQGWAGQLCQISCRAVI